MFKELCTKKLGITLEDSDIDQAIWNGPTQRDGTRPAMISFTDFHTKKEVLESARLKLRDTPYVMMEDLFIGSGENLTLLAHEKEIDSCYKKISKVKYQNNSIICLLIPAAQFSEAPIVKVFEIGRKLVF